MASKGERKKKKYSTNCVLNVTRSAALVSRLTRWFERIRGDFARGLLGTPRVAIFFFPKGQTLRISITKTVVKGSRFGYYSVPCKTRTHVRVRVPPERNRINRNDLFAIVSGIIIVLI